MLVLWFVLLSSLLAVYLGLPFFRKEQTLYREDEEIQDLQLERERTYTALLDLDFDYEAGKIEEDDYQKLRSQLLGEAAEVLSRIDGRPSEGTPRSAPSQPGDLVEAEIERFKKQRRQARS